jgi:hypothetical protein
MSVVFNKQDKLFKANDVLWSKQELVNAIVEAALINQTEAFIDMIIDGQEDMSRNGINETLRGVKESTGEFLNDMLGDLRFAIEARLRDANYGAAVTGLKFDLAGDVTDIEVDVSIS